jgi:malate synthase
MASPSSEYPDGVELRGAAPRGAEEILSPEAVRFVADLARRFESTRQELLHRRRERQQEIVDGRIPDFLPETAAIRERSWQVAPIPADLRDRRVEITGPVERKMIINALNSGANVFMADFEDSNAPTWRNNIDGQFNLRDAVRREITFDSVEGKQYLSIRKSPPCWSVRAGGIS